MGAVLHLAAHGYLRRAIEIDLETEPAPSVCGMGFGSFKWWVEMRLKARRVGDKDARAMSRSVDLDREPCPTVNAYGIAGVGPHQYQLEDDMRLKSKKKFGPDATSGHNTYDLETGPSPAILAKGLAGVSHTQYQLERGGRPGRRKARSGKPPYRVPSMAEVAALPWNGLKVASTFSGCGGSCLGYRMAGCRVVWANEFVPIAGDSYEANAAPGSVLDRRDVKLVKPEEILAAAGLKKGELDILDGSPPCQAFSTAGKRARGWGKERKYEHGAHQKNEDLFYEYIRLLRGLMPRAFVAENVSGLVKGVAKGYFIDILTQLRACGYRVEARLLDAKWLGVPQSRQRIIFVGIRSDLGRDPAFPAPLPYFYSVRDALPELGGVSYDDGYRGNEDEHAERKAAPAVRAGRNSTLQVKVVVGNDRYKPKFGSTDNPSPTIKASGDTRTSGQFEIVGNTNAVHGGKGKAHSADQPSPTVMHRRVNIERRKKVVAGSFQHFKNKRDVSGQPCPALLTAQPVHYLVENDGSDAKTRDDGGAERRKFTIAELKRICAYPDDFQVLGKYAQQWAQFGNSVPPVMMMHIARAVAEVLKA